MKFEEILPLMRNGAKARLSSETEGKYWICGYQGFCLKSKALTIHRVDKNDHPSCTSFDWGIPRWMIMRDDWEVV